MLAGTAVLAFGLLLPYLWPQLAALYVSAALIGVGFVFFNVSVQNLAGGLSTPEERTRNFSTLGLGYSDGHMLGPLLGGYAIDYHGFTFAYLYFAALTVLPVGLLAWNRRLDVAPRAAGKEGTSTLELLHSAPPGRSGEVTGLRLTINNVTHIGVPLAAGALGSALGVAPVSRVNAAILATSGRLSREPG